MARTPRPKTERPTEGSGQQAPNPVWFKPVMFGFMLLGLAWIIVYYVTSQDANIPVFRELGNYNLLVGIGFMTTGFVYATRWE